MTPSLQPRSVAVVLGTRPEIIKLAPIIRLLGDAARVIHTGQHYDSNLSKVFFDAFHLPEPAEHLAIGGISRGSQIGEATTGLDRLFAHERPAAVVVQGDTNTVLAASLAANAREIALVHVEAGLRSFDRAMPEEHNRVIADHLSDLCLAPTEVSVANLRAESIPADRIVVTGNTVVESLEALLPDADERARHLAALGLEPGRFILSTLHRPENVDNADVFASILEQLAGAPLPVVLPIHPRSRANAAAHGLKHLLDSIRTVDPMAYPSFLALLAECGMAVADSGGIQEEVSILKRPLVVVRRSTERPEVIGTFAVRVLPGPAIGEAIEATLEDLPALHQRLAKIESPYGDGSAGRRSVAAISALVTAGESG